ncbi:MAG TPA: PucR family transcriptional regulator [Actinomycetes bacterium]|nr:PucR family transcriptional regulator [Actinomycetes bacterium]
MAASLTVDDLLRSTALQLELLAGSSGLSRRIAWAHVSELEDPTPWLLGADLVMTTGMAVPKAAAGQRAYLKRLDDAGVSALAVSDQLFTPALHRSFLDDADRRGFPVLRVPLPVPFIAIAQEVAAAVQSDMHRRLTAQLHVFGALQTLASEDLTLEQLFSRLEALSGYALYVSSPSGRALLPGVPAPPPDLIHLLPESYDSPPTVPDGYVLPVLAPGGPAGFLLAIERPDAVPSGLAVVQHVATIAALQLSIQRHERETLRREGAETLAELLQGVLDPATAQRRLARIGHPPGSSLRLAVVRPVERGPVDDQAVLRAFSAEEVPALVLRQQRDLVVLLPADVEVSPTLAHAAVGVSRPFGSGEPLTVPRREASWAVARAVDAGGGVVVFGQDAAGRWLTEDAAGLRGLVDAVLGPVLEYDAAHGGQILPSVRTWLEHDRRTTEAAGALHVHANTLGYRLHRFEVLTGRSLQNTADLAEVWLAVHAVAHAR